MVVTVVKTYAKYILYFLCYYLGIVNLFCFLNRKCQIILNYHHVLPSRDIEDNMIFGYSHSLENFRRQIEIVESRFELSTVFGEAKTVIITFDDGARNNYIYACPVLKQYGITAYFFIIDAMIDSNELLWVDKWFLWLSKVPCGMYNILGNEVVIQNQRDRVTAHTLLWNYLREHYDKKDAILAAMESNYSFSCFAQEIKECYKERYQSLSANELEAMKDSGHFVGFHSYNHDILNSLDRETLSRQLETIRKRKVYNSEAFAIPFGRENDFDESVLHLLTKFDFQPILLNQENTPSQQTLGRMNLPNTANRYEIHANLSGLHHFLENGRLLPKCV